MVRDSIEAENVKEWREGKQVGHGITSVREQKNWSNAPSPSEVTRKEFISTLSCNERKKKKQKEEEVGIKRSRPSFRP